MSVLSQGVNHDFVSQACMDKTHLKIKIAHLPRRGGAFCHMRAGSGRLFASFCDYVGSTSACDV